MEAEDKITEEVRRRIKAIRAEATHTIVKKQGNEEINRKLNEKITGSTQQTVSTESGQLEEAKTEKKVEEELLEVKKKPVDE